VIVAMNPDRSDNTSHWLNSCLDRWLPMTAQRSHVTQRSLDVKARVRKSLADFLPELQGKSNVAPTHVETLPPHPFRSGRAFPFARSSAGHTAQRRPGRGRRDGRYTWLLVSLCIVSLGCREGTEERRTRFASASTQTAQTHLQSGLDFLERMDEFQEAEAAGQVSFHLNRWLATQDRSAPWSADDLVRRLPRDVRESGLLGDLDRWKFDQADIQFLMQAELMHDLANWIAATPLRGPLAAWYETPAENLDDLQRSQYLAALRLFDWTIRNIQLDETLPYPDTVVGTTSEGSAAQREKPPSMRGIPGPGYQFYPWQTLVFGHGDVLARARIFMELCRQHGIESVMLAEPGQTNPPRPIPWLPAIRLGQELYLFDTELGIPIPSQRAPGVATLSEAAAEPQVLASLTTDPTQPYRMSAKQLKGLIALVEAAPIALSRRMKTLETQLTGQQRMVLTVAPHEVAQRVGACAGIDDVVIWPIAVETVWYQTAFNQQMSDPRNLPPERIEALRQYLAKHAPLLLRNPLTQARRAHFRAEFENVDGQKGAKVLYSEARVPNATLESMLDSQAVQQRLGLAKGEYESEALWRGRLASSRQLMQTSKDDASYWLGLVQYDSGRPEAAVEWFARRTLEATPDGPWTAGARYNLARTYEALGDYDQALDLLYQGVSPQSTGDQIRARYLARLTRPERSRELSPPALESPPAAAPAPPVSTPAAPAATSTTPSAAASSNTPQPPSPATPAGPPTATTTGDMSPTVPPSSSATPANSPLVTPPSPAPTTANSDQAPTPATPAAPALTPANASAAIPIPILLILEPRNPAPSDDRIEYADGRFAIGLVGDLDCVRWARNTVGLLSMNGA
jgi:tetratricopeptide (TPR) repeat protein